MHRIPFLILSFLFTACGDMYEDVNVIGMKPEYISSDELLQFEQQPSQPIEKAGKIMLYQSYVFLGEINKGIHIIDMSDTANPVNLSFLKIPGNKDLVAQDDRLYADNGPHLLTLNISDIQHITLVQRSMNVFRLSELYPAEYSGYFECVDETKGWISGWNEAHLADPKCKTAKM